ncbi:Site-specific recombinase XerD [Bacteroidales bacterium Barb7]|nr:Site-specific recombinase XerD [Bacteroidales bacterium Barb7]
MLGHTNIKTTQIYARITDSKISDDMAMFAGKMKGIGMNLQSAQPVEKVSQKPEIQKEPMKSEIDTMFESTDLLEKMFLCNIPFKPSELSNTMTSKALKDKAVKQWSCFSDEEKQSIWVQVIGNKRKAVRQPMLSVNQ